MLSQGTYLNYLEIQFKIKGQVSSFIISCTEEQYILKNCCFGIMLLCNKLKVYNNGCLS
jgi:hypothetical protein